MKLFSIIKTFDKKEWTGFLTYIQLHHSTKSIIWKVAYWMDSISIWRDKRRLSQTTEMILLELPFKMKSQALSKTFAILGNLAEEYVGWLVWKNSSSLKRSCQLKGLAQKSLSQEYVKTQKNIFKDKNEAVISIWNDYYKMQALFDDYYFGLSPTIDNHTNEFKKLIIAFKRSTATIGQFLLIEIRNRENLLSESWNQEEEYFELICSKESDIDQISNLLLSMSQNEDLEAYNEIGEILRSKRIDNFSKLIQYSIVTYCFVFLHIIIKKGAIHKAQELLDLYEYSLEKGIYTPNNNMSLTKFLNIIGIGSKMEKYEWSRKIVDNWSHKVDIYNEKLISKFGHATIDFHQKKFAEVVMTLSQINTLNFDYKYRSRWLLLKAQYELNNDYVDVIKVQIDNFRRLVLSNELRINKSTFEGLKASIKILNMILSKNDNKQIENTYSKSKYIFDRKWVIKKIKKA